MPCKKQNHLPAQFGSSKSSKKRILILTVLPYPGYLNISIIDKIERFAVDMFYLVHIDHNGGYQGVIKMFATLKTAKKYLDDRPEFRRCGQIAVHSDSGTFARMIVEIPLRVKKDEYGQYGVEEPYRGEEDEEQKWKRFDTWNDAIDKALDIVEKHVSFLSDWDPYD